MNTTIKTCAQTRAIQSRRIFPFDVNMHQTLFGGNLTRIIDDCASITVSRHCRRLAVTASVDAMNYLKPLPLGHSVCVETYISGWTFVALPREGETDFAVPAIEPETAEEKFICSGYEDRRLARLEQLKRQEELMNHVSVHKPWMESL